MNMATFALAHPIFDPERQLMTKHTRPVDSLTSAGLSVNIGME